MHNLPAMQSSGDDVAQSGSSFSVQGPQSIDLSKTKLTSKQASYYQEAGEDFWEYCAKRVLKKEIPGKTRKDYNQLIKRLNGENAMGAVPPGAKLLLNVEDDEKARGVHISLKAKWYILLGLWIEKVGETYALRYYYKSIALPTVQSWNVKGSSPVEPVIFADSAPRHDEADFSPRMEVEILSRAERTRSGAISMVKHRVRNAAPPNAATLASHISPISLSAPLPADVLSSLPRAPTLSALPRAPALSALVSLGSPATEVGDDVTNTLAVDHFYGMRGAKRVLPDEFFGLAGEDRASKIPRSSSKNCDALVTACDGRMRSRTAPAALASQPVYFYMPPSPGTNMYDYSPERRNVDRELAIAQFPFFFLETELYGRGDYAAGSDVGTVAYSMEEAQWLRAAMHEPAVGFSVSENVSSDVMAAQGLTWFNKVTEGGGEEVGSIQAVLEARPTCVDPRSHDLSGV